MLKLEQVRLTKYPTTSELPAGFKWVSERKEGPKKIVPFPYNWYGRHKDSKHYVFHMLALANQDPANPGVTVDELKAQLPESDKMVVDEIITTFKAGTNTRPTGWDLISTEDGTKFALVYRDPRTHFASEAKMEGDHSGVAEVDEPSYIKRVQAELEAIKNPKPKAEPKERAPRKGKSSTTSEAPAASAAPAGGYLKAYSDLNVTAKIEGGGELTLLQAIDQFVQADATYVEKEGDEPKNVRAELLAIIDAKGLEDGGFVDFLARRQRDGGIKAGLYKICKEITANYTAAVKAQTEAPVPASAPAA